jgi:hypothetical protein
MFHGTTIKRPGGIFATAARIRSNRPVHRAATTFLLAAVLCAGGCARSTGRPAPAALAGSLRTDETDFSLAGRREVAVLFTVVNRGSHVQRLEFPTDQRLEVTLHGPDGRPLFLWSEDRLFAAEASVLAVNPGERLEYAATIPTRDMTAGRDHTVEAVLPGHPGTAATLVLRPR